MLFCRGSTDLVLIAARALPFFAGHHRTTGAGLSGLNLASAPGVCAWPLRSAPSLRKQATLDGIFSRYFFSSSSIIQKVYMGFSTDVAFTSTKRSACSPTCRGIFLSWYYRAQLAAPPTRQYVAPYSRMHIRLSPSNAAALTRH